MWKIYVFCFYLLDFLDNLPWSCKMLAGFLDITTRNPEESWKDPDKTSRTSNAGIVVVKRWCCNGIKAQKRGLTLKINVLEFELFSFMLRSCPTSWNRLLTETIGMNLQIEISMTFWFFINPTNDFGLTHFILYRFEWFWNYHLKSFIFSFNQSYHILIPLKFFLCDVIILGNYLEVVSTEVRMIGSPNEAK